MAKVTENSIMTFGIHKGKKIANVPADYLVWIFENNKVFGGLLWYIRNNYDDLKKEAELMNKYKEG